MVWALGWGGVLGAVAELSWPGTTAGCFWEVQSEASQDFCRLALGQPLGFL